MILPLTARRDGFVLLVVLWTTAAVAVLALAASLAARDGVATARNRVELARAAWGAEGCLEIAHAEMDRALATARDPVPVWRAADSLLAGSTLLRDAPCTASARVVGVALDVNSATAEELHRLIESAGVGPERADSLVDALLDWRDADDVPRSSGAEREWYVAHHRIAPRNGLLADPREVALVRGFAEAPMLDSLLDTEPGRILLTRAPPAVLRALPGFTLEAIERVAEMRTRGASPSNLEAIAAAISPSARDTLMSHYSELAPRLTADPDAWLVICRMTSGQPGVTVTIEARLVRAGARAALLRRRSWP